MELGQGRYMAETLYMYFDQKIVDDRRRVIKDFCFPCGVSLSLQPSLDFLKRQLIKDKNSNHQSCYVFSLNGQNPDQANSVFSEVFCMCVQFHDFIVDEKTRQIYMTEKAFCLMFSNTQFKVQQKVLITLKNIYLENRINLLKQAYEKEQIIDRKIESLAKEDMRQSMKLQEEISNYI